MSTKVFLRQKEISNNRKSLYLDFYPAIPHPVTGKLTRREFLGMYIFEKPKDIFDKEHNIESMKVARAIRSKRENRLNKPEIYSQEEKEKLRIKELGEKDFIDYCHFLADKRTGKNRGNWLAALKQFQNFIVGQVKIAEVNETLLNDFKDFLLESNLSQNSAVSYFAKVKTALRQAFKDGILQSDLGSRIEGIKEAETRKEYLTLSELNKLAKTSCNDDQLRRAGLFSALTGLRFSDIEKLDWNEVTFVDGQGYFLNFTQRKTSTLEVMPISDQAAELLGIRREQKGRIFSDLHRVVYNNGNLQDWLHIPAISDTRSR